MSPLPTPVGQSVLEYLPVYRPDLSGNERAYVLRCIDTGWISSLGEFVSEFEKRMASELHVKHAIAVSNGTVALHLAIHCLGIGPGDEVIVPTFTYIASVNTIAQTGARPVFVDCAVGDWLIDVEQVAAKITPRTKAVMAVHLYGAICDMTKLRELCRSNGLSLIEDCAEALGSTLNGIPCGGLGDVGTFSFFGNKTITTGEGGLVTTNDDGLADELRLVKGQGQSRTRRYWHERLGFNYRMTNICAAIGLAQLERLSEILIAKRKLASTYRELFAGVPVTAQSPADGVSSSEWLVSVLLPADRSRDDIMDKMLRDGVETRPLFHCAHQMPMYLETQKYPCSEDVSQRGISLPSYPGLSRENAARVVDSLAAAIS